MDTWTSSPLWDAHITATSRSERSAMSSMTESETAAWSGFIEDRENTARSGSPAWATTRPSVSDTATYPRWQDSSSPDRTTRTSVTGSPTTGA